MFAPEFAKIRTFLYTLSSRVYMSSCVCNYCQISFEYILHIRLQNTLKIVAYLPENVGGTPDISVTEMLKYFVVKEAYLSKPNP